MIFEEDEDDGTIHIAPRCIETKLELLGMTVFAESPLCGTVTHDMVAKTCLGVHWQTIAAKMVMLILARSGKSFSNEHR